MGKVNFVKIFLFPVTKENCSSFNIKMKYQKSDTMYKPFGIIQVPFHLQIDSSGMLVDKLYHN